MDLSVLEFSKDGTVKELIINKEVVKNTDYITDLENSAEEILNYTYKDIFKYTKALGCIVTMLGDMLYLTACEYDYFTGKQLMHQGSTYRIERAGLVSHDVFSVLSDTVAKRMHAALIPHCNELLR